MTPNPYDPPGPYAAPGYGQPAAPAQPRTMFILAALGSFAASAYWALLTLLIGLGAALGAGSGFNVIVPVILIVLYALRGAQIWRGDANAARRVLWLHGIGCIAALAQAATLGGLYAVLQGLKVVIHLFGGVTAYLAQRQAQAARYSPSPHP